MKRTHLFTHLLGFRPPLDFSQHRSHAKIALTIPIDECSKAIAQRRRFAMFILRKYFSCCCPCKTIFAPTVITQPGCYVVMKDISLTTGPIITIKAHNVTLDLAGHTLTLPLAHDANEVIRIESGFTNIYVKNGSIIGGSVGIKTTSIGSNSSNKIRISIKNITVENFAYKGITIGPIDQFYLIDSRIISDMNSGVGIGTNVGRCTGMILRNTFRCADSFVFEATNMDGALIKGNQIFAESDGFGISVIGNANIIEGNGISKVHGYPISVDGNNNSIINNTVGNSFVNGIRIQKDNNLISGNVVGHTTSGVSIEGLNNLIEGNILGPNNEYGIDFISGSNNVYRNNMLRGNVSGPVHNATGNTDAGGNIV